MLTSLGTVTGFVLSQSFPRADSRAHVLLTREQRFREIKRLLKVTQAEVTQDVIKQDRVLLRMKGVLWILTPGTRGRTSPSMDLQGTQLGCQAGPAGSSDHRLQKGPQGEALG